MKAPSHLGRFSASLVTVSAGFCTLTFAGTVVFEDVTVQAGIAIAHTAPDVMSAFYCREEGRMAAGAAAVDANNDGLTDLFVTRVLSPNLLFINNGDGTFFEDAAAAGLDLVDTSSGVAFADIDNDGDQDLYVLTILGTRNYLYLNDGSGGFTEVAESRGVDGFAGGAAVKGTSATFGDYDNDGDLDLHTVEWTPFNSHNFLYANDSDGFFANVTLTANVMAGNTWGFSTAFADIDNDTHPDLLIAADFGTSRLFHNNGDGTFTNITASASVATDENGMGSAIADYDDDGDLDWFVTSIFDPRETCETEGCNWDTPATDSIETKPGRHSPTPPTWLVSRWRVGVGHLVFRLRQRAATSTSA